MKINVLGTEYEIQLCRRKDDKKLRSNPDISGYCDFSVKKIVVVNEVLDNQGSNDSMENLRVVVHNILRHEIFHSYCFESSLDACSPFRDELVVDFIALALPKLTAICIDAESQLDKAIDESTKNVVPKKKSRAKKS